MIDLNALQTELTTDPQGLGYTVSPSPPDLESAALADTALLNAKNIASVKAEISGSEVFKATNSAEFDNLTDAQRSEWLALCAIDSLDPANGTPAAATATRIFGGGSVTITNLQSLRNENISRAQQLFGQDVVPGDVQKARLL